MAAFLVWQSLRVDYVDVKFRIEYQYCSMQDNKIRREGYNLQSDFAYFDETKNPPPPKKKKKKKKKRKKNRYQNNTDCEVDILPAEKNKINHFDAFSLLALKCILPESKEREQSK